MPARNAHEVQAAHNLSFVGFVSLDGRFLDWAVTGVFYEALHCIDSYLADAPHKTHPKTHGQRQNAVSMILRPIWKEYRQLQDVSRAARYHCTTPRLGRRELADAKQWRDTIRKEVDGRRRPAKAPPSPIPPKTP